MTYSDNTPIFMLYGEQKGWPELDRLHCETIAARSRLYNWHIRLHRHSSLYQILYLHQGTAKVQFAQHQYEVNGPAIVEIPQSFVHGFEFASDCVGFVLTISYPLIIDLTKHIGHASRIPEKPLITLSKSIHNSDKLFFAFKELNNCYLGNEQFRIAQAQAWLTLIYTKIRKLSPSIQTITPNSKSYMRYNEFIDLLEQNYLTQHLVHWYAKSMHITTSHLNLIVRSNSNNSPLEHIHNRINLEANRCLIYTTMTISEISYYLGFIEPAHFSRFFRLQNKQSPKQFRDNFNHSSFVTTSQDK